MARGVKYMPMLLGLMLVAGTLCVPPAEARLGLVSRDQEIQFSHMSGHGICNPLWHKPN